MPPRAPPCPRMASLQPASGVACVDLPCIKGKLIATVTLDLMGGLPCRVCSSPLPESRALTLPPTPTPTPTPQVWMGCWGLAILLVLVLLAAVLLNWPGGLVTAGLLLMVLLVASQVGWRWVLVTATRRLVRL